MSSTKWEDTCNLDHNMWEKANKCGKGWTGWCLERTLAGPGLRVFRGRLQNRWHNLRGKTNSLSDKKNKKQNRNGLSASRRGCTRYSLEPQSSGRGKAEGGNAHVSRTRSRLQWGRGEERDSKGEQLCRDQSLLAGQNKRLRQLSLTHNPVANSFTVTQEELLTQIAALPTIWIDAQQVSQKETYLIWRRVIIRMTPRWAHTNTYSKEVKEERTRETTADKTIQQKKWIHWAYKIRDQLYCHNSKDLRKWKVHPGIQVTWNHTATQRKEMQYGLTEFRKEKVKPSQK